MVFTILYGTQTGNAERLAFRIARMAIQHGIRTVRCLPADEEPMEKWDCPLEKESADSIVLFVVSNANQGDAPNTFRRTWARLLQANAPQLRNLHFAVFGLGDSLYTKFNYMAKMLHNRLRQLGATPLLLRGLGDESDAKGIDETLLPWLTQLWVALGILPAGTTTPENPLNATLFPLYDVKFSDCAEPVTVAAQVATAPVYSESTFACTVRANVRLTPTNHFQAVHHLDLQVAEESVTDAVYEVGDALGVYCTNRPQLVESILHRLSLNGNEVVIATANTDYGLTEHTARPFLNRPMSTRFLFQHYVDLDAVVDQELFWMLSSCVEPVDPNAPRPLNHDGDDAIVEMQDRLRELANPVDVDGFLQYSHREKRNICEVLYDFNASTVVKLLPSLQMLLSFLTPMRPRLFSLSSSPLYDPLPTLHLTVAQLAWQTPMRRQRTGLCSTALVESAVGFHLRAFIWQGSIAMPDMPTPLLCVATGSGVAPMRAMVRQCAARATEGWADVPLYLFFGCRNEAKDFLYASEWATLKLELPKLKVIPAFSRDTAAKVYVQHQLGQHSKLVGSLLQPTVHSVIYVCGNAKQMPKDVHSALVQIAEAVTCEGDENAAMALMKRLAVEGRYQVDTWSA